MKNSQNLLINFYSKVEVIINENVTVVIPAYNCEETI